MRSAMLVVVGLAACVTATEPRAGAVSCRVDLAPERFTFRGDTIRNRLTVPRAAADTIWWNDSPILVIRTGGRCVTLMDSLLHHSAWDDRPEPLP